MLKIGRFLLLCACVTAFFTGCASYTSDKFLSEAKLNNQLPPLLIVKSGDTDDLKQIVDWEIRYNICERHQSQEFGAIAYNVDVKDTAVWSSPAQWFYAIVSGLTLTSINLLGFPIGRAEITTDISVRIFDSQCKEIASYTASEKGVAHKALYWGYDGRDVVAAASGAATKKCMEKIKDKLMVDATRLRQELTAGGEATPDYLERLRLTGGNGRP